MTSYKHIKATPVEDDDIIVVAGVGSESVGSDAGAASSAPLKSSSSAEGASPATFGLEPSHSASADEPLQANAGSESPARDDGYRETTLSDIEQAKMSSTQLVVIGVSLICLGAFIIWYIFFS